ncbi:hypothetical protein QLQ15_01980 [Lysobacter sp. LF1]|uniref:Lipoprotein n=1 Tax=Lysobacter stagni TaxID=3045172 RepID=A0ABT6XC72_9GAMM|nr:hypothetical protein [Lysobacter sp. LF1]MDI9237676.1 hypothetical protein [Lysobacter sp. LF1]
MSKYLSFLLLGLTALTACDRHTTFRGTVAALDGQPLKNCTYEFESRGRRMSGAFDAPRFDEGYAVGFQAVAITFACEGYAPVTVKERSGGDLGRLVLTPVAARLPQRQ